MAVRHSIGSQSILALSFENFLQVLQKISELCYPKERSPSRRLRALLFTIDKYHQFIDIMDSMERLEMMENF